MEYSAIKPFSLMMCLAVLAGCKREPTSAPAPVYTSSQFHSYWHAGKAEINAYELQQSRYGEMRSGKAVLIFVTEDLSKKLQVKLDNPDAGRRKINVLKLNYTKKFLTGIYPYSLMLSVFTPVDRAREPRTLKATMSSQEWCGQVYTQMNLRGNRYAVKSHSYFEEEADEQFSLREATLEDEIWNFIRLDHEHLPTGELEVIPGLFHTRLNHVDLVRRRAVARKTANDTSYVYSLTFPNQERSLSIRYEKNFPFRILGWEETWKEKDSLMRTTAVLERTLYTDYWTKNKNEFLYLRDSLNLPRVYP